MLKLAQLAVLVLILYSTAKLYCYRNCADDTACLQHSNFAHYTACDSVALAAALYK
jgi:hypothetical protein